VFPGSSASLSELSKSRECYPFPSWRFTAKLYFVEHLGKSQAEISHLRHPHMPTTRIWIGWRNRTGRTGPYRRPISTDVRQFDPFAVFPSFHLGDSASVTKPWPGVTPPLSNSASENLRNSRCSTPWVPWATPLISARFCSKPFRFQWLTHLQPPLPSCRTARGIRPTSEAPQRSNACRLVPTGQWLPLINERAIATLAFQGPGQRLGLPMNDLPEQHSFTAIAHPRVQPPDHRINDLQLRFVR